MTVLNRRICLLSLAMLAAPVSAALGQTSQIEGAWLEEGSSCADVFVATRNGIAFKRPANAFSPAFIIKGRRLTTPLATCTLVKIERQADRQAVRLNCATAVAVDSAQAIFAMRTADKLVRFHSLEGGIATHYQRCTVQQLNSP